MSHRSFWREKQYEELEHLHLPGPSVVIDVRRGTDRDPPLIWNIGIELEDLSTEMELNKVYRWRYLTHCIDLLKLAPSYWDEPEEQWTNFNLTLRTGHSEPLPGKQLLIRSLKERIDTVRTNRIAARRDQDSKFLDEARVDPEQVTVRIFFLVDAEDKDSLVSAAVYAKWLKIAYHEYKEVGRSGREKRISTLAICMNTDPYMQHPEILAQHLNHNSPISPALDAVILLHTYSDDEAYIGGNAQAHQVELILYTLLLLSLESLMEAEGDAAADQNLSPYIYEDDNADQLMLPWPIFMMGVSSLEYSARWGGRWLDYGLVAKISEILYREDADETRDIHTKVQKEFEVWRHAIQEMIAKDGIEEIAGLSVFGQLKQYLFTSPFREKGYAASVQELNAFIRSIRQLYIGKENTLESSIEGAGMLPWQIQNDYEEFSKHEKNEPSPIQEAYQNLRMLRATAVHLPTALFKKARGSIPRLWSQLSEVRAEIDKLCEIAESSPDLNEWLKLLDWSAKGEVLRLQRCINDQRWPFGRRIQQEREASYRRLKSLIEEHIKQAQEVIAVRVALALLQEARLYKPGSASGLFQKRLKSLDASLKEAQQRAFLQKQRAYRRLQASLNQNQGAALQVPRKLNLNNRRDLLNWVQLVESYDVHAHELEKTPLYLDLLMRWLLQLLEGENPVEIIEAYLSQVKGKEAVSAAMHASSQMELHMYNTLLVAVLILFGTISFDIVSIEFLLEQYIKLKNNAASEHSALETNILGLQSIIREAKATASSLGRNTRGQPFTDASLPRNHLLELIVAAWVNNLYAEDSRLAQVLNRSGILTRLAENNASPIQVLKDLQARNRLPGYRDNMAGDDLYYLLLAPGQTSDSFLKEVALTNFAHIRPVRFPDPEKLIYLHIHRIRQAFSSLILSPRNNSAR